MKSASFQAWNGDDDDLDVYMSAYLKTPEPQNEA